MKILTSWKLALNLLVHSKLRSWLTIIGIVIGIAAVVSIVSIGQGAQENLQQRLSGLGADIITISKGFNRAEGARGVFIGREGPSGATNTKNLTNSDVRALESISNIKYVGGSISGRTDIAYLSESTSASVNGVDTLVWKYLTNSELDSGRFLDQGDSNAVVIGYSVANTLFKNKIQINRQITINGKIFRVVGILKQSGGFGGSDNAIYMPINIARNTVEGAGSNNLDSITIKVKDTTNIDQTVSDITQKLLISRGIINSAKQDFSVSSSKTLQESISSTIGQASLFLGSIAAVSLIVGAVGVANTIFTSVIEKTKEIGIMKAIGARNIDILLIFVLNSALIGLIGGLIGIALGSIVSAYLPSVIGMSSLGPGAIGRTTFVTPQILITALVISVLIGVISGVVPSYMASKLKPVDALRYE